MEMNVNKFSILILMAIFALPACRERGPAEEAGRNLDEAAAAFRDRAGEISEELGQSARQAWEEVAGALNSEC
jgi:hypothetical protein